eukprot:6011011-Alexandrium_andersonii.AAC.1
MRFHGNPRRGPGGRPARGELQELRVAQLPLRAASKARSRASPTSLSATAQAAPPSPTKSASSMRAAPTPGA